MLSLKLQSIFVHLYLKILRLVKKGMFIRLEDYKGDMETQKIKVLEAFQMNNHDWYAKLAILTSRKSPIIQSHIGQV